MEGNRILGCLFEHSHLRRSMFGIIAEDYSHIYVTPLISQNYLGVDKCFIWKMDQHNLECTMQ